MATIAKKKKQQNRNKLNSKKGTLALQKKTKDIQDSILTDDVYELIECWTRDGFTKADVAEKLDLPYQTFCNWYRQIPRLREAMSKGRELVDYKVESALLKSALGYKAKEVKIVTTIKHGTVVETTKEITTKDVAPSVPAIQMWLHNRQPEKWRKNRDNFFDVTEENSTIHVNVVRASHKPITSDDDDYEDEVNEGIEITNVKDDKPKKRREKERGL